MLPPWHGRSGINERIDVDGPNYTTSAGSHSDQWTRRLSSAKPKRGPPCQPLPWSRSSAENSSPERGCRTTTRVHPGATTRPRRRSLRSRPRGCRRPRALRWQPSARVQGLEPREPTVLVASQRFRSRAFVGVEQSSRLEQFAALCDVVQAANERRFARDQPHLRSRTHPGRNTTEARPTLPIAPATVRLRVRAPGLCALLSGKRLVVR
jgi:hypothetical protein